MKRYDVERNGDWGAMVRVQLVEFDVEADSRVHGLDYVRHMLLQTNLMAVRPVAMKPVEGLGVIVVLSKLHSHPEHGSMVIMEEICLLTRDEDDLSGVRSEVSGIYNEAWKRFNEFIFADRFSRTEYRYRYDAEDSVTEAYGSVADLEEAWPVGGMSAVREVRKFTNWEEDRG